MLIGTSCRWLSSRKSGTVFLVKCLSHYRNAGLYKTVIFTKVSFRSRKVLNLTVADALIHRYACANGTKYSYSLCIHVHHRPGGVRSGDMTYVLHGLAGIQSKKQIRPPLFDYDPVNRVLRIVDSTLFFFLAFKNKDELLEEIPSPIERVQDENNHQNGQNANEGAV